jgi:hypothetical protein
MSTPSSHHGRASIPSFAKPIIEAYAAATQPATISLAIVSAFTAMLIPLLVALFYFSTPRTRSRPTFIFASFDICLGIVIGAWGWYIHVCRLYILKHPLLILYCALLLDANLAYTSIKGF